MDKYIQIILEKIKQTNPEIFESVKDDSTKWKKSDIILLWLTYVDDQPLDKKLIHLEKQTFQISLKNAVNKFIAKIPRRSKIANEVTKVIIMLLKDYKYDNIDYKELYGKTQDLLSNLLVMSMLSNIDLNNLDETTIHKIARAMGVTLENLDLGEPKVNDSAITMHKE